jgi:hypothetical protein
VGALFLIAIVLFASGYTLVYHGYKNLNGANISLAGAAFGGQ